jgi:hypothetical protein
VDRRTCGTLGVSRTSFIGELSLPFCDSTDLSSLRSRPLSGVRGRNVANPQRRKSRRLLRGNQFPSFKLRIVAGLGRFRNSAIPRSAPDLRTRRRSIRIIERSGPPSLRVDSGRTCRGTGSTPTRPRPAMIVPDPVPGLAPVPPRHTGRSSDHQCGSGSGRLSVPL